MSEYKPAVLIPMCGQESSATEIIGQAIVTIFRDAQGVPHVSGTFKSTDKRLYSSEQASRTLYEYRGVVYEGSKQGEIAITVSLTHHIGDLHEMEAGAEPVVVRWLDAGSHTKLTTD